MSTNDYLKKLDLDQLRYARDKAQSLINDIEEQEKVKLWVVSGVYINEACFKEDDFYAAKERLCKEIMSDEFTIDCVIHDHPKINAHICYESEVAEMMTLNK